MLSMMFDFLKIFYLVKFFYLNHIIFFSCLMKSFFNEVFVMISERSIKTILNFYRILYVIFMSEILINKFSKIITINA